MKRMGIMLGVMVAAIVNCASTPFPRVNGLSRKNPTRTSEKVSCNIKRGMLIHKCRNGKILKIPVGNRKPPFKKPLDCKAHGNRVDILWNESVEGIGSFEQRCNGTAPNMTMLRSKATFIGEVAVAGRLQPRKQIILYNVKGKGELSWWTVGQRNRDYYEIFPKGIPGTPVMRVDGNRVHLVFRKLRKVITVERNGNRVDEKESDCRKERKGVCATFKVK